MAEWSRVVNTTIRDYMKGWEDAVMRKRKLLNKIKDAGGVKLNQSGDGMDWKVRKARGQMATNDGTQTLTFQPKNRFATAFLDFQGYVMTEAMTKREKLKNRNAQAIVKVFENQVKFVTQDLEDQFAEELYIDSAATGNSGKISGVGTLFGTITQTLTTGASTPTARSASVLDPAGYVNTTYANISTALGASGAWSGAWPQGKGDAEFDFWTPLAVNTTSSFFDGTSTTWALNCVLATRFGIIESAKNCTASEGQCDFALFDRTLYRQFKDKLDTKERVNVNEGKGTREYGQAVDDSFMQEGAEITWEYGIPTGVGYGFNISQTELHSMQDTLFGVDDMTYDPAARQYRWAVDFLGQLKHESPRTFVKWLALA